MRGWQPALQSTETRRTEHGEPQTSTAPHRRMLCRPPGLLAEPLPARPALPLGPWISRDGVRASLLSRPVAAILFAWTSTDPSCR
jgi:hypothetical protein